MGNFQDRDNRGGGGFRGGANGGRPPFQKKPWGNDRGGERNTEMHKATCSDCGKSCEVPFRPSGDKPVFCKDCFSAKREGGDREGRPNFDNRGPKRDFGAPRTDFVRSTPSFDDTKKQLSEINSKLDRLINTLEKFTRGTTNDAPVIMQKNSFVPKEKNEVKERPSLTAVLKKAVATKSVLKKIVAKKKPVVKKK